MDPDFSIDMKIYPAKDGPFSMQDMLEHFAQLGTMRVSDLHLKAGCPPTYRVDGALRRMDGPPLDAATVEAFASVLLPEAKLAMLKKSLSVDGSFNYCDIIQFRLNCFYDSEGMAVAIRALDRTPPPVEHIGFPNAVWQDIVQKRQGLVLVTGITGSGKSTTIASLIQRIGETHPCRVITLEDPIEYRLDSRIAIVSQREIGRDVQNFAQGLRDCLREDPDLIFVGEMRDRESAAWTLRAAETGHLVFSTLHTRDARGTITRILDMFPPIQQHEIANQLSMGLSHIICQKLVARADGKGRVVAMEILNNTLAVANLIRGVKVEQIMTALQTRTKNMPGERMTTLERSLAVLVKEGKVTGPEAERWANDPLALVDALRHATRADGV
ncbi:MAG: PilT/PilU family type 4a pilus ATPase [Kiritimatiellae bacterium]|nr:PilT/PilU family type 4a pilus ATPase [Kiritimatiellia bacterium]